MLKEFKKFILRGNVIDLAVGVIIGAAFNNIVSSLVTDIITPPLGLVLGQVQFSNFFIALDGKEYETLIAAKAAGAPIMTYGIFLDALIAFLITAIAIFFLVKFINRLQVKSDIEETAKEPDTKKCPECLSKVPIKAKKCAFCTSDIKDAQ